MMQKLAEAIRKKNAPVVVGLDPQLTHIPERILRKALDAHGETLEGVAEAFRIFNREIIDAVSDLAPAVKPQSAMYEMYGVEGVAAYRDTIRYAHEKGLIVIGDIKRGDIGSTSAAYAEGHLGRVKIGETVIEPFGEDIATVNPYLGSDGIKPFLEVCRREEKAVFVLVKTSNPSSGELQDLVTDGVPLYEKVAAQVASFGAFCGAVTGATYPGEGSRLRELMPDTMLLVPGYGAQGAKASDLLPFFREDFTGAIINSSRGITCAWQTERYNPEKIEDVGGCARSALIDMIEEIRLAWEHR